MTNEDDELLEAITDQLNAEIGAKGLSMRQFAEKLGRPYDSTRNYLRKERALPMIVLIEGARVLDIEVADLIARARQRIQ